MLTQDAKSFLRKYPPFSQLDDHALMQLVQSLTLEVFTAGAHIMRQGDRSSGSLHIIKEGSVRIYARTERDREMVIDFRGPGDTFGSFPLARDRPLDVSAQAVSDTVCYVADREGVVRLLDGHPELNDYFLPPYFPKSSDRTHRIPPASSMLHYGSENALFTTPVRELANRDIITVRADAAILDAVRLMSLHRADALIIVDPHDRPTGIFTVADLRDKVMVQQRDVHGPVGDVSTVPVVTVDGGDLCFEALLKMTGHDVHHVLVMDAGNPLGLVSNHDFMVLQVTSPLMIVKDIERQGTIEGLSNLSGKVTSLTALLLSEGARAGSINRIITTVNDRIQRKILDLSLQVLGPPPLPFCWIVYGSAGRKEQTFITDQDNGLIYADPQTVGDEERAKAYFSRLAEFSVNAFLRCGYSLCPGEFMATNPKWRQPLSVWRTNFRDWIQTPADEALHNAVNLFDFRALHGDLLLASDLKKHLAESLREQNIFLKAVADLAVDYRPPLGLFGALSLEKDGVHANQLDLKKNCLTPLTNITRLFSFECRIPETSTLERLRVLKQVHPVVRTRGSDLEYSWEFLTMLRIRHQLDQVSTDIPPDNFINPRALSSLEQRNLQEICRMLSGILDDIHQKYAVGTKF